MELLIKRLTNLLTIKSIVTLTATAVFSVLALRGDVTGGEFLAVFTTIVGFYFGTQHEKKNDTPAE